VLLKSVCDERVAIKDYGGLRKMAENLVSGLVGPDGVLNVAKLAEVIGKKEESVAGKVMINWRGEDLQKIHNLLHDQSENLPALVKVNGPMPAWLATAIVHECHPAEVSLNSQQGYVKILCQAPKETGAGMKEWKVFQKGEWTQVEFTLDGEISPEQLLKVAPPKLPMGSLIIISGRGPLWVAAAVAMSYHGIAQAVACLQPKVGSTVCVTHTKEITLGSVIPE
jgi:CRISPR-associated Csx3 family protein